MKDVPQLLGRLVVNATLRPAYQRYGLALVLPLLAMLITATLTRFEHTPFFPMFTVAVLLSSLFGGMTPGLVTVAESVLINLLATPPVWSLRVASQDDAIRIALFACAGCVVAAFVGATGELQQQLEQARSRLSTTLRSIGDAVIATDAQGKVTFMNSVAEQATGWRLEEATGCALETIFKIVNESTRLPAENPIRNVLERGIVMGLANHTVLLRRDGTEIPIDDSAAPIRDTG